MELLLELFATVVIAVLISFLIAKLVSLGGGDGGNDSTRSSELSETKNNDQENSSKGIDEIITRDSSYLEKFQTESCKNEKKAEFVQDFTQKVDHKFCGESIQEDLEHNREIECLVRDDVVEVDQKNIEIIGRGDGDDDDDDWEGIERSELEKMFAKAANFVEKSGDKEESLEMELYGLHKVATEGPCREQPPMPLKLAARAKWNAWQKLGNMNPEEAMEQYITLLSDKIPGWMEASVSGNVEPGPPEAENPGGLASDLSSKSSSHDPVVIMEGNLQVMPGVEKIDVTGDPNLDSRAKE